MLRCSIVRALRPGLPVVRCGPIKSPYLVAQGLQRNYSNQTTPRQPVPLSGALRSLGLKHIEVKPALGTEFQECSLMEIMSAPNSDELVRDLAVTISRRGVVVFRNQNDMTKDGQKALLQRMGELTGKPKESGLHIHPMLNPMREGGGEDYQLTSISSRQRKIAFGSWKPQDLGAPRQNISQWHSDISMETVPSDYTSLRLEELPMCGGDTTFASMYELYDRISKPMQKFLEGLTATYTAPFFTTLMAKGHKIFEGERGHPENKGNAMEHVHPVIRTNPVTGWKAVYAVGSFASRINELTPAESELVLNWLMDVINRNHDLAWHLRWNNKNDMAIWDNRSVVHQATYDYDAFGERFGWRTSTIGEHPYLDPNSKSRREALKLEGANL